MREMGEGVVVAELEGLAQRMHETLLFPENALGACLH